MDIYNSTEYIDNPKIGDLKLKVNSIWDFKSRSVCFQDIEKSFGGGNETISYDLEECVDVRDGIVIGGTKKCKNTKWKQAEITDKIKKHLKEKGYIIFKEFDELFDIGVVATPRGETQQYAVKNTDGNCDLLHNLDIKQFISKALDEQKKELLKDIRNAYDEKEDSGVVDFKDIIKIIG